MKTAYLKYADALEAFLECQEPIKVTKTYHSPTMDIWDSPSELCTSARFESEDGTEDAEEETEDSAEEQDSAEETDGASESDSESAETTEGDAAAETAEGEESGEETEGEAVADDTIDLDNDFADVDDFTDEDSEVTAGDVNSDDTPASVSASRLMQELTEGDDNVYTRVANAAKDMGMTTPTVKELLPVIAMAVKKFMKNKNYASISKQAMKGIVMKIAETMSHPPKDSGESEEA